MKIDKSNVITTMDQFATEINRNHPNTATANFLFEMSQELKSSEGVAFTGTMQTIINRVPLVKMEDSLIFSDAEARLWQEVSSFNQLGNNLFSL